MPEQEPIRDPRAEREEEESRVTITGDNASAEHGQESVPNAFQELHTELAKTGVISDAFKDYILRMALAVGEEEVKSQTPSSVEQEALRQEFISRRFDDKTCVKLNSRSLEELASQCFKGSKAGGFIGALLDRRFPDPHDAIHKLFLGTYEEVIAVREWLWREINENPEMFCDIEKECREA